VRELAPEERTLVVNALKYFDGERYALWSYVVMNDHVHVIVEPAGEWRLRAILHSWKSFTAHAIQRRRQKRGTLWQDESFDRVVRDEKELHDKNAYILGNPGKRWPALQTYPWVSVWS
jgi:REP element-mobilizing transposase RayT